MTGAEDIVARLGVLVDKQSKRIDDLRAHVHRTHRMNLAFAVFVVASSAAQLVLTLTRH